MNNEMPMGLALIVCDTIIQDKQTNKRSIIGMFDRLYTHALPCVHPTMGIYVSLTSGRGEYACEIICRHTQTNEKVFAVNGKVIFKDPLQIVHLVFNVQAITFKSEGEHWLTFNCDDVPVMMRRIFITLAQEKDGE